MVAVRLLVSLLLLMMEETRSIELAPPGECPTDLIYPIFAAQSLQFPTEGDGLAELRIEACGGLLSDGSGAVIEYKATSLNSRLRLRMVEVMTESQISFNDNSFNDDPKGELSTIPGCQVCQDALDAGMPLPYGCVTYEAEEADPCNNDSFVLPEDMLDVKIRTDGEDGCVYKQRVELALSQDFTENREDLLLISLCHLVELGLGSFHFLQMQIPLLPLVVLDVPPRSLTEEPTKLDDMFPSLPRGPQESFGLLISNETILGSGVVTGLIPPKAPVFGIWKPKFVFSGQEGDCYIEIVPLETNLFFPSQLPSAEGKIVTFYFKVCSSQHLDEVLIDTTEFLNGWYRLNLQRRTTFVSRSNFFFLVQNPVGDELPGDLPNLPPGAWGSGQGNNTISNVTIPFETFSWPVMQQAIVRNKDSADTVIDPDSNVKLGWDLLVDPRNYKTVQSAMWLRWMLPYMRDLDSIPGYDERPIAATLYFYLEAFNLSNCPSIVLELHSLSRTEYQRTNGSSEWWANNETEYRDDGDLVADSAELREKTISWNNIDFDIISNDSPIVVTLNSFTHSHDWISFRLNQTQLREFCPFNPSRYCEFFITYNLPSSCKEGEGGPKLAFADRSSVKAPYVTMEMGLVPDKRGPRTAVPVAHAAAYSAMSALFGGVSVAMFGVAYVRKKRYTWSSTEQGPPKRQARPADLLSPAKPEVLVVREEDDSQGSCPSFELSDPIDEASPDFMLSQGDFEQEHQSLDELMFVGDYPLGSMSLEGSPLRSYQPQRPQNADNPLDKTAQTRANFSHVLPPTSPGLRSHFFHRTQLVSNTPTSQGLARTSEAYGHSGIMSFFVPAAPLVAPAPACAVRAATLPDASPQDSQLAQVMRETKGSDHNTQNDTPTQDDLCVPPSEPPLSADVQNELERSLKQAITMLDASRKQAHEIEYRLTLQQRQAVIGERSASRNVKQEDLSFSKTASLLPQAGAEPQTTRVPFTFINHQSQGQASNQRQNGLSLICENYSLSFSNASVPALGTSSAAADTYDTSLPSTASVPIAPPLPILSPSPSSSDGESVAPTKQPILCSLCNKSFKSKFSRDRHMKTHVAKVYQRKICHCHLCDREYTEVSNLCRHVRKMHGIEPTPGAKRGRPSQKAQKERQLPALAFRNDIKPAVPPGLVPAIIEKLQRAAQSI
eukprot:gb/GEZN01000762.1/.p1 GENE.gb/GEZN01000762.1/~~gb/GEZN01000762.1/.p1  ORF type:complete len:1175 (-),score=143.52 gb/GEZN01000762.1/:146-3670(-)